MGERRVWVNYTNANVSQRCVYGMKTLYIHIHGKDNKRAIRANIQNKDIYTHCWENP